MYVHVSNFEFQQCRVYYMYKISWVLFMFLTESKPTGRVLQGGFFMRPAFSARGRGEEEEKKICTSFDGNIPKIYPNLISACACKLNCLHVYKHNYIYH